MSEWDDCDKEVAAAVGSLLGQRVWWQPMRKAGPARERVNKAFERDTNRAGRWLPDAIATFRTNIVDAGATDGATGTDRGSLIGFDLVVDVSPDHFALSGGGFSLPQQNDIFELTEEFEGNRFFSVETDMNDGSSRLIYYCQTPRQEITAEDMDPDRDEA